MKFIASKKLLSGILAVLLAGGVLFAQTQSPTSASEEAETSFTDMTEGERISKLIELRTEQLDKGNTAAAAYLQGRIDFLNN